MKLRSGSLKRETKLKKHLVRFSEEKGSRTQIKSETKEKMLQLIPQKYRELQEITMDNYILTNQTKQIYSLKHIT